MTPARIIDGKAAAAILKEEVAREASLLQARFIQPGLAVILVGDDPASQVYVRSKIAACGKLGIQSFGHFLPATVQAEEVRALIATLNADAKVHGILLQLPLPAHLNAAEMIMAIDPDKDIDGLHPLNAGKLLAGLPCLVSCTPLGTMMLLRKEMPDLTGMNAVVIGRSLLFGKPMAQLLLAADCTVTSCHSKSIGLPAICREADILIAAVGRPAMVKGDWIKPGAIVLDVGINRMADGALVGDVDFDEALKIASAITPVPGGVGAMTIACLMANTVKAAGGRV